MKKLIVFIIFSLVLNFLSFIQISPAKAADAPNLIANPSVEIADGSNLAPVNWLNGGWGTNTASFSYEQTAQDGSRSIKVQLSAYTSGDAKWYFNNVAVNPSSLYYYSDYYKSSVPTEIVVQFTDNQNIDSYLWLGTMSQSTAWQKSDFTFSTPSNVQTLTVFHFINSIGYLQTDNFSLKKVDPVIINNNVPNSSLEQSANQVTPLNWQSGKWGTNTTTFSYLNSGHTGNRSVKVQMTKYTSGDAKWFYDPQPMTAGDYQFSDYYQSNVTTQVVVEIIKNDNSISYMGLKNAPASLAWAKYADSFSLPVGTKQISVFHLISTVGYLITDDYSVVPYQIQGFNRPLFTITFDDGWEDNTTTALPVLKQYGFKSTYYLCTQYIVTSTDKQTIKKIAIDGHEIGSHSVTHPHLPLLSSTKLTKELSTSKSFLESIVGVGRVTSFATPYGEYNDTVMTAIKKYYQSHRSVDIGYNTKDNFDVYNIRVQNMTNTTTLSEFTSWVNKAQQDKTWLVIVYHRIGDNPDTYEATPQNFAAQMQYISQSGITVKTLSAAIAEITPQLK